MRTHPPCSSSWTCAGCWRRRPGAGRDRPARAGPAVDRRSRRPPPPASRPAGASRPPASLRRQPARRRRRAVPRAPHPATGPRAEAAPRHADRRPRGCRRPAAAAGAAAAARRADPAAAPPPPRRRSRADAPGDGRSRIAGLACASPSAPAAPTSTRRPMRPARAWRRRAPPPTPPSPSSPMPPASPDDPSTPRRLSLSRGAGGARRADRRGHCLRRASTSGRWAPPAATASADGAGRSRRRAVGEPPTRQQSAPQAKPPHDAPDHLTWSACWCSWPRSPWSWPRCCRPR